jgi:anaerobic selenocysteine-containing dehydrogenase
MKARGAKIVAINPVRTGYASIADEWVPVNPGTDGLLAGALIHELLRADRIDFDYLVRYSNAHHLVIRAPGAADDGLVARDENGKPLCAVRVFSPRHSGAAEGGTRNPAPFDMEAEAPGPGLRRDDRNLFVDATQPDIAPLIAGE